MSARLGYVRNAPSSGKSCDPQHERHYRATHRQPQALDGGSQRRLGRPVRGVLFALQRDLASLGIRRREEVVQEAAPSQRQFHQVCDAQSQRDLRSERARVAGEAEGRRRAEALEGRPQLVEPDAARPGSAHDAAAAGRVGRRLVKGVAVVVEAVVLGACAARRRRRAPPDRGTNVRVQPLAQLDKSAWRG